jgi:diguanylate cyclase (GGDEF)-like protein
MSIPRILRSQPARRLLEHHRSHHGPAELSGREGRAIALRGETLAYLQAEGAEPAVEGLRLALVGLAEAAALERVRTEVTRRKLGRLTSRLREAEVRLLGAIDRRKHALIAQQHRLADVASTDPLTGALNRRALELRTAMEAEGCAAAGSPMTVMVCDLDHFKRVNDEHGHSMGDEVLAASAALLREGRRGRDLVGRWGGEEFVIVLPDCAEAAGLAVAERLRAALADQVFQGSSGPLRVTMSVGLASAVPGVEDLRGSVGRLFELADERLYDAKDGGRNRVVGSPDSGLRLVG